MTDDPRPAPARWACVALLLILASLTGCGALAPLHAPDRGEALAGNDNYRIVRIGRGEDFAVLAARFLGDAGLAWRIEEANPGIDPIPGAIVAIPLRETGRSGIRPGRAQSIPVLCYHRFGTRDDGMMISAQRFAEQMDWLRDHGYHVVPLRDLLDFLEGRKRLPRKSVVLTIDDGHQSIYRVAWPILRRHGYPATVFIYSDYLGRGGLTWKQIREMSADGLIEVQAHSKTHANLNKRLPGETRHAWLKRLEREVRAPARKLRAGSDAPVVAYAYPYGEANPEVVRLLKKYHYRLGFTVFPGANPAYAYPYLLHRSMIFGERGIDAFRKTLLTTTRF